MIKKVKTPGSQMGSLAAAEEGAEATGGGRGETGQSVHHVHPVMLLCPQ